MSNDFIEMLMSQMPNIEDWVNDNNFTVNGNTFSSKYYNGWFENVDEKTIKVIINGYEDRSILSIKLSDDPLWESTLDGNHSLYVDPIISAIMIAGNLFRDKSEE